MSKPNNEWNPERDRRERSAATLWLKNSNDGSKVINVGNSSIRPPLPGALGHDTIEDLVQRAVASAWSQGRDALYYVAVAYRDWCAQQPNVVDLNVNSDADTRLVDGAVSRDAAASALNEDATYHDPEQLVDAVQRVCRARFLKNCGRTWESLPEWVRFWLRVAHLDAPASYVNESRARKALLALRDAARAVREFGEEGIAPGGPRAAFLRSFAAEMKGELWEMLLDADPDDPGLDVDQNGLGLKKSRQRLAYVWPRIRALMKSPPAEAFDGFANSELFQLLIGPLAKSEAKDRPPPVSPTELAVVWILCGGTAVGTTPKQVIETVKGGFSATDGAMARAKAVETSAEAYRARGENRE